MPDISQLMELEPYLQVAIPSGFAAYIMARMGLSYYDTSLIKGGYTLIFSFISVVTWTLCEKINFSLLATLGYSFIIPIIFAIIWRLFLFEKVMKFLHHDGYTNDDHFPNVWTAIRKNQKVGMSQITVYLTDGSAVSSDYIYNFKDAPLDLMRTDEEGNVAMYVTHERSDEFSEFKEAKDHPIIEGGKHYRLTYIPTDKIKKIEFVINTPTF